MSVVVINSYLSEVEDIIMFKSTRAVASNFTVIYTGSGTPEWTDGTDTYFGIAVDFVNWSDATEKTVTISVEETDKITLAVTTWNAKSITEMGLSLMVDLQGTLNLSNNPLTNIDLPPSSGAVTGLDLASCSLTTIDISGLTLSGTFDVGNNNSLTTITTGSSASAFVFKGKSIAVASLDLSGYTALEGPLELQSVSELTSLTLPNSNGIFSTMRLNSTGLGVVDWDKLPNASNVNSGLYRVDGNNLTTSEVDQNLIGFNNNAIDGGYTGRVFEVDGSNAAVGTDIIEINSLDNAGTGYLATEVLTITGGSGSSGTITIDTVGGSGEILTYTLSAGGTGYLTQPTSYTGGTGSGADFTVYSGEVAVDELVNTKNFTVNSN